MITIIHHHPSSSIIVHHRPSSIFMFHHHSILCVSSSAIFLMFILIHHPLLSDVWPGPFETFGATYGPTAVWPKALLSGVRDLVLRPAFFLLGAFADGRMGPQRHGRTYHFSQLPFIRNTVCDPSLQKVWWKITILNRRFVLNKSWFLHCHVYLRGCKCYWIGHYYWRGQRSSWLTMLDRYAWNPQCFLFLFFHPWSFSSIKARVLQGFSSCIVWEVSQ